MARKSAAPCIVWFRDDLRLSDHPALHAAASDRRAGDLPLCVRRSEPRAAGARPLGGAARWWLAQSLRALQKRPAALGASLVLRKGPAAKIIADLARETGAACACSGTRSRKRRIRPSPNRSPQRWRASASPSQAFRGRSAGGARRHPQQGRPGTAGVHAVLAAGAGAWAIRQSRCRRRRRLRPAVASPATALESWRLEPTASGLGRRLARDLDAGRERRPSTAQGVSRRWRGRLRRRARPARSRRHVAVCRRTCASARSARGRSGTPPALPRPNALPWPATSTSSSANWAGANSAAICCSTCRISRRATCSPPSTPSRGGTTTRRCGAWQRGRTGYPIVDAGMRELWHTGVMHNRVRMVAASFLVKHLLIDWREGEKWFWDTLVDADPAAIPPTGNGSRGPGPMPRPLPGLQSVLQGEKFDPDGAYVRRWVPELSACRPLIHQPWRATPLELRVRGVDSADLSGADRRSRAGARTRARRLARGPQRVRSAPAFSTAGDAASGSSAQPKRARDHHSSGQGSTIFQSSSPFLIFFISVVSPPLRRIQSFTVSG